MILKIDFFFTFYSLKLIEAIICARKNETKLLHSTLPNNKKNCKSVYCVVLGQKVGH
jgi:hypothetical protein